MKTSLGSKTLHFPTPACVVGTYDAAGKPNVMTAAWSGICCSRPPCVYVSLREATYSFRAIAARKGFTISIPSDNYVAQVDYFGIATGAVVDKFEQTGLTAARAKYVDAPYVEQFPVAIECQLYRIEKLGLHTMFVGEIMDIKADESVLTDGRVDIEKVHPIVYDPAQNRYYKVGEYLAKAFVAGKALIT